MGGQPDHVVVRGQRLRLSVEGPGRDRPLLLINGIGATSDLFQPFRDALAARRPRTTIAFDAPGVGGSPTPTLPMSMTRLARLVAELVEAVGHSQVDVLGLSWGGALAQELARRHPHLVRRLVLVATTYGVGSLPGRLTAMSVLATPARYYSHRYLERVAPTLYGREILAHPELLQRHAYQRATRPPTPTGYLWQLSAIAGWSSFTWLGQLTPETLVLAGDDDPIIPLANSRVLAARIPRSELHVVEGGGHLFLYLRADTMVDVVADFLDRP